MKKYSDDVKKLYNSLGGSKNIKSFTHCMTRMRFKLFDWDLANEIEIKSDTYAKGISKNVGADEYQVIIGADVPKFYKEFCKINGYDENGKPDIMFEMKKNQNEEIKNIKSKHRKKSAFNSLLSFVSKIFSPIVIPLVGYGLILTLWSLMTVEWNGSGTSAKDTTHFFEQVVGILDILVGAFSLFITILVGYTTFKAMDCNGVYGIIIGIILTAPGLINMGDVKPNDGETILGIYPGWTLFGDGTTYPWKINYNGLIIPIIIVAVIGCYISRGINKIDNTTAVMILEPLTIILGSFLFGIFIMAPIGMLFTSYLSVGINWFSTNEIAKYIAIPIIGGLYGPLVITGMHHSLTPIILQGQSEFGGTVVQGFITISNISQGIASIAFIYLHRRVLRMRDLGVSNGVSAIIGGITEPSLYTINLKHLFPLIACSIGVTCGTLVLVASNTYALQGASSIFGILMYIQNAPEATGVSTWIGGGYLWGIISIATSCSVTFIMTLVLGKLKFFQNRSRELILGDYNEDIFLLKEISNKEWKEVLLNAKKINTDKKLLKKETKAKNKLKQA